MKIKKITIAGFRGFNTKQEIIFDEKLTIIYGPNSYGKTSISEALEWLLFGITSKVEESTSGKKEFKGTYRNIHYPKTSTPFVEIIINQDGENISVRSELGNDDSVKKYLNNELINSWPWETPALKIYSPFILQHALQDMLLTKPSDRYSKFSKLLGTKFLDDFQDIFNSLATSYKPPIEVQSFIQKIDNLINDLQDDFFTDITKSIKNLNVSKLNQYINEKVSFLINDSTINALDEDGFINFKLLEMLKDSRKDEVNSIFSKEILIQDISEQDQIVYEKQQNSLCSFVSDELINQYLEYAKLKARIEYKKQADFYEIGLEIIDETPDICPFCGLEITEVITSHITKKHKDINIQINKFDELEKKKIKFSEDLGLFKQTQNSYYSSLIGKTSKFLDLDNDVDKETIKSIFGEEHSKIYKELIELFKEIKEKRDSLSNCRNDLLLSIDEIENSFTQFHQSTEHLSVLSEAVVKFISSGNDYSQKLSLESKNIIRISGIFVNQLNLIAGTQKLASLINFLEKFEQIKKYIQVKQAVESMKDLRANVTKFVSYKTKTIVEEQLTDDVMHWYEQIKTTGDPDVHFSGFSLGGRKDRHEISVLATSYDEELVSAVSSLSESKLNALGLSIKISNNVKGDIPFSFLIIDDPVQSLDGDHATQISVIIRKLIEEYDKQIFLLSHNQTWVEQLIKGCQSLNGIYYHMTGFDKTGPHIEEEVWKTWKRRLQDVNSICSASSASQIQLQQAEEEIRLAICDIASRVYKKKTGKIKRAHDLNDAKIRSMLLESGIESGLVDRIGQTFVTTDDSHHTGEEYVANKQRIMQYYSWTYDLANKL